MEKIIGCWNLKNSFNFTGKNQIMNNVLEGRLSNVQMELMQLFSTDVSEKELKDLKKMLLEFKFKRVTSLVNQVWDEKGWTEKDMERILHTHERTPYESQNKHLKNQSPT